MRFFCVFRRVRVLRHEKRPTSTGAAVRTRRVHSLRFRTVQAPNARELEYGGDRSSHADHHRPINGQMESRPVRCADYWRVGGEILLLCIHWRRGDVRPRTNRQLRRFRI